MDHHPVQFGRSDVAPEKESVRKTRSIERLIIASDNIIGWIERIALFIACVAVVAEMALGGGRITWESWINGEITGGEHPTPVWLSKVLVPVGMGLLSLRLCHAAVANLWAGAMSSDDLAYPARTKSGYTPETERAA